MVYVSETYQNQQILCVYAIAVVLHVYFCHHLPDDVDLSDLYVCFSVICVDLLDHHIDLSETYHRN